MTLHERQLAGSFILVIAGWLVLFCRRKLIHIQRRELEHWRAHVRSHYFPEESN